ncbi:MAG: hypothetical protein ACJAYD_000323, partial [Patiriisocius sp.]
MKKLLFFALFLITAMGYAQENTSRYRSKKVAVTDTIVVDRVALNPSRLILTDTLGKSIDPLLYR